MQRAAWTDERLDDMSERMDAGFNRIDRDLRGLRVDMNHGFAEVRAEFKATRGETGGEFKSIRREVSDEFKTLRGEMGDEFKAFRGEVGGEFAAVRGEIGELRTLIWRLNGGIFVAVVASFLLRGI